MDLTVVAPAGTDGAAALLLGGVAGQDVVAHVGAVDVVVTLLPFLRPGRGGGGGGGDGGERGEGGRVVVSCGGIVETHANERRNTLMNRNENQQMLKYCCRWLSNAQ